LTFGIETKAMETPYRGKVGERIALFSSEIGINVTSSAPSELWIYASHSLSRSRGEREWLPSRIPKGVMATSLAFMECLSRTWMMV